MFLKQFLIDSIGVQQKENPVSQNKKKKHYNVEKKRNIKMGDGYVTLQTNSFKYTVHKCFKMIFNLLHICINIYMLKVTSDFSNCYEL